MILIAIQPNAVFYFWTLRITEIVIGARLAQVVAASPTLFKRNVTCVIVTSIRIIDQKPAEYFQQFTGADSVGRVNCRSIYQYISDPMTDVAMSISRILCGESASGPNINRPKKMIGQWQR
jgi:hypothetical protein